MAKTRRHEISSRALVRISCVCGWYWRNEFLKGKSDRTLDDEAEAEFLRHVEDMKENGY